MSPRLGRDELPGGPVVQGFAANGFSIDGKIVASLLLTPTTAEAWSPPALAELTLDDLAPLLALEPQPEFILLGTGPKLRFPPRAFRAALEARRIGLEVMDSRAAARVWGLLRGEERWIAAALMPHAD